MTTTEDVNRGKIRITLLLAGTGALIFYVLAGPIQQSQEYHAFVDSRQLLGIDNFWNVITNLPMMLAAVWGLTNMRGRSNWRAEGSLALVFFLVGVLLTGVGSAWYHLAPSDSRLFWDRLPMTIAFMGLFATLLGEFLHPTVSSKALLPLLAIGAASAWWWRVTGDLRPYVLVQYLPIIIVGILLLQGVPARCGQGGIFMIFLAYALAKICELGDATLFQMGGVLSGHSLKHLLVAVAVGIACRILSKEKFTPSINEQVIFVTP